MALTLYPKLLKLLAQNPELNQYRKQLLGCCCKSPSDIVLHRRIQKFLTQVPRYHDLLTSLLVEN